MTDAFHVGCRALEVPDPVQGARVPVHVLYPTRAPPRSQSFGLYSLELALGAPVAGEELRLVAFSHGNGGTPWSSRGLASHLAAAGFAVALLEHPGNSRSDNSLAGTAANLANRPRHLRLALDAVFADGELGRHLAPGRAGALGHSMGGYTVLAAAGGRPVALPNQSEDGAAKPIAVEPDPRLAALVLLTPALPWLMAPGALADVRSPMLVRTGELDTVTPPEFIERVLRGLPPAVRLDHKMVPGAGHFSFLAPFPPALAGPDFPPSHDPPGFDRAAYQPRLFADVVAFLRGALS
jgi:predicted dienelactone hydrolase